MFSLENHLDIQLLASSHTPFPPRLPMNKVPRYPPMSRAPPPPPHSAKDIPAQCCGAETFCFRSGSGSDFQKVSAPKPAPVPTLAFYLPFITDFILKSRFFMFFMKEYRINLIHMLDSIQYEFLFLFTTQADPEPEPGAGA
jgi:hypothetical protein